MKIEKGTEDKEILTHSCTFLRQTTTETRFKGLDASRTFHLMTQS